MQWGTLQSISSYPQTKFSASRGCLFRRFNDNISAMAPRRIIALSAGGVTTIAVFVTAMALLFFGEYVAAHERLFYTFMALGPVAMLSVMVGYAVWWLVLFILTLILPSQKSPENG